MCLVLEYSQERAQLITLEMRDPNEEGQNTYRENSEHVIQWI